MNKFLFHASAAGLSGCIEAPYTVTLPVQAASTLPTSGGVSTGNATNVEIRDFLQCPSVASQATGNHQVSTNTFETRVEASTTRLSIGGVISVDFIRMLLQGSHPGNGTGTPSISPAGSEITNLRVNNTAIELENLSGRFATLDTFEKIRDYHENDVEFRELFQETMMVGRSEEIDSHLRGLFPFCHCSRDTKLPEISSGTTVVPLFRVKTTSGPGFTANGNVINIVNFGAVQLGQMVTTATERRVTGMLVSLHQVGTPKLTGLPMAGHIEACSVGGNGTMTDPPPGGDDN